MKNSWNDAENHIPLKGVFVLAYHIAWGIEVSCIDETNKIPIGLSRDMATHWMDLPAPPKIVNNKDNK